MLILEIIEIAMISAIIIDDEVDSLEALKIEIELYCPDLTILATCSTPGAGLDAIREMHPDVVFLDIEMPEMNGFELLQQFDEIAFHVIFVTAYDRYAIQAFDFNAQDYLLKPVLKSKLVQAVDKIKNEQIHQIDMRHVDALINHIAVQAGEGIRNLALPTTTGFEFVLLDDFIYAKAESNYVWVYLSGGRSHFLSKTLKQLESLLVGPQFVRTHHSFMININYAKSYVRGKGGYIVLQDGTQIPVSRTRKEPLMQKIRSL